MSSPATFFSELAAKISKPEFLVQIAAYCLRIAFIVAMAWMASRIVRRFMRTLHDYALRMMAKRAEAGNFDQQRVDLDKRTATLTGVAGGSLNVVIWVFAIIMILRELGFDITPLIAGAGVAGIAISLGSQNIIKDLVGGVFLLLDNQIRVGDAVSINDVAGTVEEINLRTTLVRAENGGLHIFSNGGILKLANNSREFSYWVFEFTIDHRQDPDPAIETVRTVAAEVAAEPAFAPFVLTPPEVYGVDRITDVGIVIKGRMKTLPGKQWAIGRELNRRIKIRFLADGILRARPLMELHVPEHSLPGGPPPPAVPEPEAPAANKDDSASSPPAPTRSEEQRTK